MFASVGPVLTGAYRELFATIAGCAAALTGLLFVAISVAPRSTSDRPEVIRQVRAASSILAFTSALAITLFGLIPRNNAGYAATVVGVIGILFTAAGARSILANPAARFYLWGQLSLIVLLLATFGSEFAAGIYLLLNPHATGSVGTLSYLVVASLLIGIARAWELVGDRDTGIFASIAVLTGHDPKTARPSSLRAPRIVRDYWNRRHPFPDPARPGDPPE